MGYLDAGGDRGTLFPKDRCIVSFDGTHIAYTMKGPPTGSVIALCAGFVCPDTFWTYLAPELSKHARVLIWNYRGAGVSGMPREPGFRSRGIKVDDFTIEKYAKDLEVILDHEGVSEVVLLGHSMGTQVCLEAYRLMPDRVKAFISISGPYSSPVRTFYNFAMFPKVFAALRASFKVTPRPAERVWSGFFKTPIPYLIARRTGAISSACKRSDMVSYFEHIGALDPLIMMKIAEAMHRHSAEDLLRKIKAPSLIVVGSDDRFTPAWLGRVMASRIPIAEQVIVEGGSHAAIIEQPALVNHAVIDFLRRQGVLAAAKSKRVRALRSAPAPTQA